MKNLTFAAFAAAFVLCGQLSAQDDLKPLVDLASPSEATSEDVPPPRPVPDQSFDSTPAADSATSASGGELHAYDFGISYVPTPKGLKVSGVIVGSRAAAAGVQPGDMIVAVNGNAPSGTALSHSQVQSLMVMRNGRTQALHVGRATSAPREVATTPAPAPRAASGAAPQTAYYVPQQRQAYTAPPTTHSAPPQRSYRYSPSYNYRYEPSYAYRSGPGPSVYNRYSQRPAVTIGFGGGGSSLYRRGYPGLGYGGGFGPSIGPSIGRYGGFGGPSFGRGGFGPSLGGRGRSGFRISIGF